ncbi:hypothetical protein [Methanomethylovorans sp.]|uniref:hypothetical protein n=1 Tax=Methanomethylovorans sp. TaxID=2758717 RepID=UPI00351BF2E4
MKIKNSNVAIVKINKSTLIPIGITRGEIVLITGCRWGDMPNCYGSYATAMSKRGLSEGLMSLATKGLYISDFPGHITKSFKDYEDRREIENYNILSLG